MMTAGKGSVEIPAETLKILKKTTINMKIKNKKKKLFNILTIFVTTLILVSMLAWTFSSIFLLLIFFLFFYVKNLAAPFFSS